MDTQILRLIRVDLEYEIDCTHRGDCWVVVLMMRQMMRQMAVWQSGAQWLFTEMEHNFRWVAWRERRIRWLAGHTHSSVASLTNTQFNNNAETRKCHIMKRIMISVVYCLLTSNSEFSRSSEQSSDNISWILLCLTWENKNSWKCTESTLSWVIRQKPNNNKQRATGTMSNHPRNYEKPTSNADKSCAYERVREETFHPEWGLRKQ